MNCFNCLLEFEKNLKKLLKKYKSLRDDLDVLEQVLEVAPTGMGKNFSIIYYSETTQVVKVRLACKSLRKRSMRVIYAFHKNTITFMYIEIYFKGDKENENRERIKEYLKNHPAVTFRSQSCVTVVTVFVVGWFLLY